MAAAPETIIADSRANSIWTLIDERVHAVLSAIFGQRSYRGMALNIPLAGTAAPTIGYLFTVGVTFDCRITSYILAANVSGLITVDIRRSRYNATPEPGEIVHPSAVSLPGTAKPALNGTYAQEFDLSAWVDTDLLDGDLLHFYLQGTATAREATLVLRLQDLEPHVAASL